MAFFHYRLISKQGITRGGFINLPFDSPISAMTYLERDGSTVVFARPLPGWLGGMFLLVAGFFQQRVTREELAEVLNNLAVMLKAGLPLLVGLRDSMASHTNQTLARVGREIVQRIESGSTFSAATQAYRSIFPDTMHFLIRLGEESGALDRTLRDAATHERNMDRIIRDTKGALIYPAFMFTAILAAFVFWMLFVVPQITALFTQMRIQLPWLTMALMNGSKWMVGNIVPLLLGTGGGLLVLTTAITKHERLRYGFHYLLLRLPVARLIINASSLAFITEYLSLMINSGVDIMHALRVLEQTVSNEVYRSRLKVVQANLIQGRSLREAFLAAEVFPPFVVRMIGVGEQSGTLPAQLSYIAEEYRLKLKDVVSNISKTIEPVALAIGGGMFILMAAALFMPLYSLLGSLGARGGGGGGL